MAGRPRLDPKRPRKLVSRGRLRGKYWKVLAEGHPEADLHGYVFEHRLIAEKALGRPLPVGCHVHHVDGDSQNNTPSNLVICEDAQYHYLLHNRQKALEQTGNANSQPCKRCQWWVVPNKPHGCKYSTRGGQRGWKLKAKWRPASSFGVTP